MPDRYSINRWPELYEGPDGKKTVGGLTWVRIQTKQDGSGFRRLVAERERSDLFAAWILMVEITARLPRELRGHLVTSDGRPLEPEDMAVMTGWPVTTFERALKFFSSPKMAWLYRSDPPGTTSLLQKPAPPATSETSGHVPKPPETSGQAPDRGEESRGDKNGETSSPLSPPPAETRDPVMFQAVVDSYNELCTTMPGAQLTENRKKVIRARWNEHFKDPAGPLAWFIALFRRAAASDFLTGRKLTTNSHWRCDLDWLLAPTNCQRVLEGKYDNRGKKDTPGSFGITETPEHP